MVIPRSRSSGALSIPSNATALPPHTSEHTRASAAVRVVLPWSPCPIVPTFPWGLERSNVSLAIEHLVQSLSNLSSFNDAIGHTRWCFRVLFKFHGVSRTALRGGTQVSGVTEHFGQRYTGVNYLTGQTFIHTGNQT